jgi:hypothetical protein
MLPVYGLVKSSDMVPHSTTENSNTLSSYQTYAAGTIKRENFFSKNNNVWGLGNVLIIAAQKNCTAM